MIYNVYKLQGTQKCEYKFLFDFIYVCDALE